MATVTIALISHDRLKKLEHMIYEMQEQTRQPDVIKAYISGYTDREVEYLRKTYPTITFSVQPDKKDWGHDKRAIALKECETDYINTVNDDDQYVLIYLEVMMQDVKLSKADIVYCNFATRTNPDFWIDATLERGRITNGNMLISQKVAHSIEYRHRNYAGDWFFVEDCIKAGITFSKVPLPMVFCY